MEWWAYGVKVEKVIFSQYQNPDRIVSLDTEGKLNKQYFISVSLNLSNFWSFYIPHLIWSEWGRVGSVHIEVKLNSCLLYICSSSNLFGTKYEKMLWSDCNNTTWLVASSCHVVKQRCKLQRCFQDSASDLGPRAPMLQGWANFYHERVQPYLLCQTLC